MHLRQDALEAMELTGLQDPERARHACSGRGRSAGYRHLPAVRGTAQAPGRGAQQPPPFGSVPGMLSKGRSGTVPGEREKIFCYRLWRLHQLAQQDPGRPRDGELRQAEPPVSSEVRRLPVIPNIHSALLFI